MNKLCNRQHKKDGDPIDSDGSRQAHFFDCAAEKYAKIKNHTLSAAITLMFMPSSALAHVKWFVKHDSIGQENNLHYSLSDPAVQSWAAIIVAAILLAFLLNHLIQAPPRQLIALGRERRGGILRLVQLLIGVPLLITAVKGTIIAPHLAADGALMSVLQFVEGVAGILLIANLWVPIACGLLILLMIGVVPLFGYVSLFEYSNILGMAIFLGLMSVPAPHLLARYKIWALPLLRVIVGIALIVLAFTEKLLNPELALQVIAQYDMNFMKAIGIPYSDHLFVLSAGFCEVLFGAIFVLGLVTRINVLALAVFLIASNTYFFMTGIPAEGIKELIGHSPLFAAACILLVYGGGEKLKAAVWIASWVRSWNRVAPRHSPLQNG